MHAEDLTLRLCACVDCWAAILARSQQQSEWGANLGCRTEAREELRRQIGTLRFDLSSLAAGLDKPKRKEAARLQKAFFQKVTPCLRRVTSVYDVISIWNIHSIQQSRLRATSSPHASEKTLSRAVIYRLPVARIEQQMIVCKGLLAMQVDDLDYAIRIKSPEKASEALSAAQSALDTAIAAV